jgi:hypothetical protein
MSTFFISCSSLMEQVEEVGGHDPPHPRAGQNTCVFHLLLHLVQVEESGGRDPLHPRAGQNTCVFHLLLFTWCRWKRVVAVTLSILVLVIMVVVGVVHTHRKRDDIQLLQNLA